MTQEEQNILSQLNDAQRQAVVYDDGPELVVAGAGSGKTRVLTYKIVWLLEHEQLKPWAVLALTFTNKVCQRDEVAYRSVSRGGEGAIFANGNLSLCLLSYSPCRSSTYRLSIWIYHL